MTPQGTGATRPKPVAAAGPARSRPARFRALPFLLLIGLTALFFILGGGRYLSFSALAENRAWLEGLVARWGVLAWLAYIGVYVIVVAASMPAGSLLTIAGGFLFGMWLGTLAAIVAATIGGTAAFLAARAGLGGVTAGVAARAGPLAQRLEGGFRDNAFGYLLVLRLVPLFPFWLVTLVAAVTRIRLWEFVGGTVLGIIPATFAYASLGDGLGGVMAAGGAPDLGLIFRWQILLPIAAIAGFVLLGIANKARRGAAS